MYMRDLPDTPGSLDCAFAFSASAAIKVIRTGKVATDAGDQGAISLWYDGKNKLRGSRCVHMAQIELKTFKNQAQAAKWYRQALKKIA
jgi:hypothetical protein